MRHSIQLFILFIMFAVIPAKAQFAPPAGLTGSTAISKDTSLFLDWANTCIIQRGYMDIAHPDSGYASVGDGHSALGIAGQNGVVSLGDGGVATLTFTNPIYNGDGFDFAVFENGFTTGDSLAFLEFAFVEVSSDGINFYRFPATSYIPDTAQIPMSGINCARVNNLAGKYIYGYGTPFDLDELKDEVGLDVNQITHVKLIDVVGSVDDNFATYDNFGHKINDPYPTPYPSSGFDLDAVGVIHSMGLSAVSPLSTSFSELRIHPDLTVSGVPIRISLSANCIGRQFTVYNAIGTLVEEQTVLAEQVQLKSDRYQSGIYFVSIGSQVAKLIVQ